MLSNVMKEHLSNQTRKKEVIESKRKQAIAAANELTQALVEHLNLSVAQAYLNQKKVDEEVKLLHLNVANFSKQAAQWATFIENFNTALKEIGDLENWSKIIEDDMTFITDVLEHAYKGQQITEESSKK